jgi:hypothetical protein
MLAMVRPFERRGLWGAAKLGEDLIAEWPYRLR